MVWLQRDECYREANTHEYMDLAGVAPGDFFELLGVPLGAEKSDIKAAFRKLQRVVHPDIAGSTANDVAILMNAAYSVLMNDTAHKLYVEDVRRFREDTGGTFTDRPVSAWSGAPDEQRAVFVDESVCIGCRNCTHAAPDTFAMEDTHGRARVFNQWADDEEYIREAIEMCPVDCIHFVQRKQLALLEFVMKGCPREDIAIMARRRSGNMGSAASSENPFVRAEVFLKHRMEAVIGEEGEYSMKSTQDEQLAAAIAKAWLQLPQEVREKGWSEWLETHGEGDDGNLYSSHAFGKYY